MSWLISIGLGLVIAVLGVEVVRFTFENWLKLYPELSLTDACLILLIVLQTATLVHLIRWQRQTGEEVAGVPRAARPRPASTGTRPPSPRRRASGEGPPRGEGAPRGEGRAGPRRTP